MGMFLRKLWPFSPSHSKLEPSLFIASKHVINSKAAYLKCFKNMNVENAYDRLNFLPSKELRMHFSVNMCSGYR